MKEEEYIKLFKDGSLQKKYFEILRDKEWHCRKCAQQLIGSEQLAGGGGVQGLQRGGKNRPGIVIETKVQSCGKCEKSTRWDRWTGEFKEANAASSLPLKLQEKIFNHYNYIDIIEQRKRQPHDLVIDHRLPMERRGVVEEPNDINMTDDDIQNKFQLLKKDDSGNHNLLKSRACEHCIKTGKRGYPLGIKFYYEGSEEWPEDCPICGVGAEKGCIGCGWYDFEAWRNALNKLIKK